MSQQQDTDRPEGRSDSYHFDVVRRAIAEIDAAEVPLSLEALAGRMGMSPAHFQRLFSAWAGVSPKRYQQYLALDQSRRLLAARHSVLDTALAAGLSGTGRLHDLFLRWEAMSPGEYAAQGAGLDIGWCELETPFGPAVAMASPRGLCGLGLAAETGIEAAYADLAARWPAARFREDVARVRPLAMAAIRASEGAGGLHDGVRLHLLGGSFQIKVWEALLQVPEGAVTTYSDIATAIGHPRAQRAVGSAVGRNPLAWLIPCHRVLRRDGALGGYHWGLPVKRAMLARESLRRDTAA